MRGYHGGLGPGMIAGFLAGKMGKYLKRYLPGPYWDMYKATFSDGAVFAACRLFRKLACEVAEELSYTYPLQDDANMTPYLKHVRLLPADAKEIL
ncbi:aminoglycoside 6-adenylyltransferase [Paenibacillus sp. FSL W8-0194]|uniref:aminoglycoside 6-adenylyltransferase n=1 Tax=Paenibacillus sp. FSL W8-0194 TaxID=2921711 RepID=UPI0030D9EB9B